MTARGCRGQSCRSQVPRCGGWGGASPPRPAVVRRVWSRGHRALCGDRAAPQWLRAHARSPGGSGSHGAGLGTANASAGQEGRDEGRGGREGDGGRRAQCCGRRRPWPPHRGLWGQEPGSPCAHRGPLRTHTTRRTAALASQAPPGHPRPRRRGRRVCSRPPRPACPGLAPCGVGVRV